VIFYYKDKCSKCFDSSIFIYVAWDRFMTFSMLFYNISTWGNMPMLCRAVRVCTAVCLCMEGCSCLNHRCIHRGQSRPTRAL